MSESILGAPMRLGLYGGLLSGGGAERVLSTIANCLSERGHDVTFFCDHKSEGEYRLNPDVALVYLGDETDSFIVRNFKRTHVIRETIKAKNIQVLLSFLEAPSFRAAFAVRGTEAAHVLSVRNDPSREYPGIARILARTLFSKSDAIVFQTSDAMASFSDVKTRRRAVIANPVPDSCFFTSDPGRSHKVVTLGRLSAQKNQAMLIDAFAEVAPDIECATLEIYGVGELENELLGRIERQGLSDRAFLMGRTDKPGNVLKGAGVFVLSSDFEGMPNALMEAMAAGLPVISTDCSIGGPKELIRNGESGFLVPVGGTHALAAALKALLSDDETRSRVGKRAQKEMDGFRTGSIVDKWEAILEEACRR